MQKRICTSYTYGPYSAISARGLADIGRRGNPRRRQVSGCDVRNLTPNYSVGQFGRRLGWGRLIPKEAACGNVATHPTLSFWVSILSASNFCTMAHFIRMSGRLNTDKLFFNCAYFLKIFIARKLLINSI